MSFTECFFLNAKELLTNPSPRQEERLDYAQIFFSGLQMVSRVVSINGYARNLDYDQINEEELLWLASEIRELPNPDSAIGDYRNRANDWIILRDQVARSLFEKLTMEEIIMLPGHREEEVYF